MWEKLGGLLGRKAEQAAAKTVREEALDEIPKEEPSMLEKAGDYLDRPASVVRQGIHSAMSEDGNALEDMIAQARRSSSEAPTGADIADRASEKFDIQNPYALGAIATAADLADPTMLIPGGQGAKVMNAAGKFPKLKRLFTVGDKKILADHAADAMKQMEKLRQSGAVNKGSQLVDTMQDIDVTDALKRLNK